MYDSGEFDGADFEAWLTRELRRPLPHDPARPARIMARVRAAPPPRRRAWVPPAVGLALAAGLAGLVALHPRALAATTGGVSGVPAGAVGAVATARAVRDTICGAMQSAVDGAVRDTVRLVRFALVAPGAARVAVVGDFNGWNPRATPLARDRGQGRWVAELAVAAPTGRYAFVVDDTGWVDGR